MSSQRCKQCKYSALCLTQKDGWRHVFAELFFEAGTRVGLYQNIEGRLITPETKAALEQLTKYAEEIWLNELLPPWCPNRGAVLPVRVHVSDIEKRADIYLEFKR